MSKVIASILTFDRIGITSKYLPAIVDELQESADKIVIWDNGSSDSTWAWLCDTYSEMNCVVLHRSNYNMGKMAVNEVFKRHVYSCDLFIEVDDDMELPVGTFRSLVSAINSCPEDTCFVGMNMTWGNKPRGFASNWQASQAFVSDNGDPVCLFSKEDHDRCNGNLFVNGACRISRACNFAKLEHRGVYGTDVDINRQAFSLGFQSGFVLDVGGKMAIHKGPSRFYKEGVSDWEKDTSK